MAPETLADPGTRTDPAVAAPAPVADVDVVIVSYRCRDLLWTCLSSLAASAGVRLHTVVVDNDSRDGTADPARLDELHAELVQMGYNSGFARAVNRGLAGGSARYVLLLNPDTVVPADTVRLLVEYADAHPDAGVIAPRLTFPDGRDQLTARRFPTPWAAVVGRRSPLTRLFPNNRWSTSYLMGRDRSVDGPFEVDWVSGAAMLVPRRVVERVGPLDEGFFLFWEDADWCRRIKDAGFTVWCVPTVTVVHDEGGTRQHGWPPPAIRSFHAGAYRYWRKHHAPQPWNPVRWLAAALLAIRAGLLVARYELSRRAGSMTGERRS